MSTVYHVQAPDGSTLHVEGPDNASDSDIQAAAAAAFNAPNDAPAGPMPSDQYRAHLHQMLADPKVGDDAIHQFVTAQHRTAAPGTSLDPALAWRAQHPGQGGRIQVTDNGPNTPTQAAPDNGAVGAAVHQAANGWTWGMGDKIAAGLDAVLPIDKGAASIWDGSSLSDAYHHNAAALQASTAVDFQEHPWASTLGTAAGAAVSPLTKLAAPLGEAAEGAGVTARVVRAAAPDAAFGLSYGAGQSQSPTWGGVAKDAAESVAGSVVGGAAGRGLVAGGGRVLNPAVTAGKQMLIDRGVTLTPGQLIGGPVKWLEDHATSIPGVGWAINAARGRGITQFGGVGAVNEALAPLGEKVPEDVAGNQAISAGQDVFSRVYAQAHSGVNFDPDVGDFRQGISTLKTKLSEPGLDSLTPDLARKFDGVVKNTLLRRVDPQTGLMDGDTLQSTLSSIKRASREARASSDSNTRAYGKALDDLVSLVNETAGQDPLSNPESVALLRKANAAYANFRVVQNAAARAGAEPGVTTPSQLLNASRNSDRSPGKTLFNNGKALMQGYAQAGKDVLPSSVGDSGTAGRLLAARVLSGGTLGLGSYEAETHGHSNVAALLGAGALATGAYGNTGLTITNKLLLTRTAADRIAGQQLYRIAPRVGALIAPTGALAFQGSAVNR